MRSIFDFRRAARQKVGKVVYSNAHSSERRSRGEVVCSPDKHVARVDVGVALHPGSASRELVLSLFDRFSTFAVLQVKKRRKWFTRMRTRASAVPEEKLFVRPKSTLLASMSV